MLARARNRTLRAAVAAAALVALFDLFAVPSAGLSAAEPASGSQAGSSPSQLVIRPAWLIEVESGERRAGWAVRTEGERIAEIGPAAAIALPAGARLIELPGATLLPGLIDAHVHLTWDDGLSDASRAAARATLDAGFTTVRSCGAPEGADLALAAAIERGEFLGPRVVAAGAPLGREGGVCAGVFPGSGVFTTREQALAHVARLAAAGAAWVKICAGGGVVPGPADEQSVEVDPETLAAITADAHRRGMKVAAHAQGPAAIRAAAIAGVDSIEHGALLDEESARLLAARGIWLVPTLYRLAFRRERAAAAGATAEQLTALDAGIERVRAGQRRAVELGVRVALGTDATVIPHGLGARELRAMTELGLSPIAALRAATIGAAELLGWSDRVGSLAPGHFADLVAVEGDPLASPESLSAFERVVLVVRGGRIVSEGAAAASSSALQPPAGPSSETSSAASRSPAAPSGSRSGS